MSEATNRQAAPSVIGAHSRVAQEAAALEPQWCVRSDRIVIRVTGDDRATFLQGMCSNDVMALVPGAIAYVLFLTEHAHVVSDAYIWAHEDALWLDIDRELWPRTREHLEKFLVADDVELDDAPQLEIVDVLGEDTAARLAQMANAAAPAPWHFVTAAAIRVANLPRLAVAAATLIGPRQEIDALLNRLADGVEIGLEALQVYRIEAGYAQVGRDTGDKTLALEARLERAISFNKGCYVGQETVERATSRGGVRKRLFGLRIEGPAPAP